MSYVRRCSAVRVYIYTHTVCVPGPTPSPAGTDSAALNSEKFSHGVAPRCHTNACAQAPTTGLNRTPPPIWRTAPNTDSVL